MSRTAKRSGHRAPFPSLVRADAHVLPHPLGGEGRKLRPLRSSHCFHRSHPGCAAPLEIKPIHFDLELLRLAKATASDKALTRCRRCRLVRHLEAELTRRRFADQRAPLGVVSSTCLASFEDGRLRRAHDAELAIDRGPPGRRHRESTKPTLWVSLFSKNLNCGDGGEAWCGLSTEDGAPSSCR